MDIEKMRKWLEITNEHKPSDFWTNVLKRKSPEDFFSLQKNTLIYDIYQDEQHTFVIVELPGVYEEELTLRLLSRTRLHIKGNITPLFPKDMGICQNRYYGEIDETIDLPEPAEPHFLQAQCVNGLLHISYPRLMEHIPFQKKI
ncbi:MULTISPECIES: Hsp20/alpha crystallin family protein [Bacillus amyloliquefaciens group]|uniref:Hsp20/alpha crystallin family protein n=1 Tax=Bacillus amyloliquefaciens group TaxID=1938374 RepID=UPI000B519AE1|nr:MULTISPECIES: Hsp20/alpha crystallin family protein [Bacillus amyloliquefaciens group]ASF28038.1 spore coat protein [Bacillus amyloliquefaciens]MDQ8094097.1 Hsp20/alpha crystallin family protein [Bacillus amyloliquefaciens]